MNDRQRDYFRAELLAWKDEILRELKITLQTLQEENVNHPDSLIVPLPKPIAHRTARRDRQRKLISKMTQRYSASRTTPTVIARRLASRFR